jgi:hypothetical protein
VKGCKNLKNKMRKGRPRDTEIHQRRKRREKMRKLREKYLKAKTDKEREEIIQKALRINPFITREQFLEPILKKLKTNENSGN